MLHRCLSAQLLSLRLGLTGLRLVQRRLGLLRLILGLGHSVRRRRHLAHSRGSVLQLGDVILAECVHRASLADELSIRRNSLIDTSREIGLAHIPGCLIQRAESVCHRPQRCRRFLQVLDLRAVELQRIEDRTTTARRRLQRSDSALKRADLLFQSTNALRRLIRARGINVNVNLNRLVCHSCS